MRRGVRMEGAIAERGIETNYEIIISNHDIGIKHYTIVWFPLLVYKYTSSLYSFKINEYSDRIMEM